MKRINVNPPCNTSNEEFKKFFKPFLKYNLVPLSVQQLKNIFVTYSGYCINKNGLIKESHHNYPHQFDDYLQEASLHYYNCQDHPENLITLENETIYLIIHHPWYNYYHWICESILRLWMVKSKLDNLTLLLPNYYRQSDFIMGSLVPFNIKQLYFIPNQKSLLIKHLCLPQVKPICDSYDKYAMKQIRNFYLNYVRRNNQASTDLGECLYISRKKAARKKVANEEELKNVLGKYNFRIINNEDFSFLEQIAIYSNAKFLISIHGSGLTNMLFMKPHSVVLELYKTTTNDKDWHSHAFWYLADALGHRYFHQFCQPTNVDDDYFQASIIVNVGELEQNIQNMIKK